MIFSKGQIIANYTVAFPHKQSAYAETYRVKDNSGKTFFLKLINHNKLNRHQIDDDGEILEIKFIKQMNHHNICKYCDSGSIIHKGCQYSYLVTEFISGETLDQRFIRDKEFSVYEIKSIAKAILSSLSYIHSLSTPIVHNEVTIQNIMLDLAHDLQDLKLIDFGHASYLNRKPTKTNLKEINVFYLAPERFSGVSSVQSDLYAVGVLMYQLLFETLPWFIDVSRYSEDERIEALLDEREKELKIPDIQKFELDEQFINIIIKSLSFDAEDRFQSADEFIKALNGEIKIPRQSTKRKYLSNPQNNKSNTPNIDKKKGEGFAAVAGMEELKSQMREEVILPLNNPEEYKKIWNHNSKWNVALWSSWMWQNIFCETFCRGSWLQLYVCNGWNLKKQICKCNPRKHCQNV